MRVFYITFMLGVALIVGGFFYTPIEQIDGSVLMAVGLLILFATIEKIPEAVKAGKSIKVQKGDFSAELNASNQD